MMGTNHEDNVCLLHRQDYTVCLAPFFPAFCLGSGWYSDLAVPIMRHPNIHEEPTIPAT